MRITLSILSLLVFQFSVFSQVTLDASSEGRAYDIITAVLAPGGNPVETPDCSHPEFGDHIDMVFDSDLNDWVFRFHIHKVPDNDRCINFDRQRNEIKTYDKSPDNLLGIVDEIFEFKWRFKIDAAFQASSSFTHIHQLKAVGGSEESIPLITLTLRKGLPDKLQIRYAEHITQETIHEVDLTPFKGAWVEVLETVRYGEDGVYTITIKKVENGTVLLDYSSSSIRMWKTDAEFIRPKWGIYRSLNNMDDLRDEIVFFANFSIDEYRPNSISDQLSNQLEVKLYPNPAGDIMIVSYSGETIERLNIYDLTGRLVLKKVKPGEELDLSGLSGQLYIAEFCAGSNSVRKKILKK